MARKETFRQKCIRLNNTIAENDFTYDLRPYERNEAVAKIFPAHPIASKARAYCSDCGGQVHNLSLKECPHCHAKWGKVVHVERASHHKAYEYLCMMTVMEDLQVLRFWYVGYLFRPGHKTDYKVIEVERQFINDKGERHGFAKSKPMFTFGAYDAWNFGSQITIKNLNPTYYGYYGDTTTPRFDLPCVMTVIKKTIPLLHRNGLRRSLHGAWYPAGLCLGLLKSPQVETLWKQKQWRMADYVVYNNRHLSDDTMAQVRVCTKHHYRISDAKMWIDHIRTLYILGLDTHSPHYICPKNLIKMHDEMNDRLRRRREKDERERRAKEYAEQLRQMEKEKQSYVERLGKLLLLSLSGRNISIRPLQSVDEFAEEGMAMRHCVFANKYYKHPHTLILSAKDDKGKRLATIEYNTQRFDIVQCRAACNRVPERDKEIRELITNHRKDFERLVNAA